ncbi:MAG: hypothetical protein ABW122_07930 [Ilumatobacteraceae bacterium]
MASITTPVLTIVRDVANVDVSITYTINWSEFDRNSDLQYLETWKLIEDDTGQDGDEAAANGDDAIVQPFGFAALVSANGQASTPRTLTRPTMAFSNLDKDVGDDEIRAVVTLTPQLPLGIVRESAAVVLV